ncbi:hypothetical protein ACLKMH_10975 [Psychromonas sp. KJ10-10]|uniref:hypothetical protein n=1 Tax=Psychromonas sp. KJ10-10 TaxID=3391823 RepID=UPI0039B3A2A6
MNSDHGSVDMLNDYLYKHYQGSRLHCVNRHSGGRKSMSCDVFMIAIDYLNIDEFISLFQQVSWDKPEQAQLMIKTEGQSTFTLYQAKL